MIENLLIYTLIAFILYLVFSIKKPSGAVTTFVHGNNAKYKLDNYFGSDRWKNIKILKKHLTS